MSNEGMTWGFVLDDIQTNRIRNGMLDDSKSLLEYCCYGSSLENVVMLQTFFPGSTTSNCI